MLVEINKLEFYPYISFKYPIRAFMVRKVFCGCIISLLYHFIGPKRGDFIRLCSHIIRLYHAPPYAQVLVIIQATTQVTTTPHSSVTTL